MEHIRTPKEVGLSDSGVVKTWNQVDNVKLLDRFSARNTAIGTLYLTTTHLIFVDSAGKKEIWILHMHMGQIEKLPITTGGSPLQLHCKNFMCMTFVIPRERDCHDIYSSLLELSKPVAIESLYAFAYTLQCTEYPKEYGWDMYDTQTEYLRMGIPNELWVLSNINKDYEICDTYPQYLYVPACATTPVLYGSSKFRSRGRLPVLSYLHSSNQTIIVGGRWKHVMGNLTIGVHPYRNPDWRPGLALTYVFGILYVTVESGYTPYAAICRCSQPLSGFSARCMEDEQMLHAILKANPKSQYMYVIDTRPKINAMANKAAGKGYENENFYSDIKFQFLGIENIHTMRSSLQKLTDVCELKNPSTSAFLSGLEASGWMKHIRAILETSVAIAKSVIDGISVLVHCSDGWDRTAQTCSMSSLMLDPYYRSIQGFMSLIEKEWLSFGHKFTDRCGLLGSIEEKQVSPVFTQFEDCVWQLMQQFPCAFQFNERFLLMLHDHVYSCQFGTFIGNCEKDRLDLKLSERTYSLWGFLTKHMCEYLNPLYKKEYEIMHPVLIPKTVPQALRFWRGMYNRFENGIHPRDQVFDILGAAKDHSSSLEDHVRLLEKRFTQICRLLGKSEDMIQRTLQGFMSMESLDGIISDRHSDDTLTNKIREQYSDNKTQNSNFQNHIENHVDCDNKVERTKILDNNTSQVKSDTESGFDESGSQMSRSGIEDRISTLEPDMLSLSTCPDKLTLDQLTLEVSSVAVDWRSFRNIQSCSCAMPFDHFTKKFHCWKCGEVFCTRCIARNIPLPGHYTHRPVPVCKPCYKDIRHSPSMDFNLMTSLPSTT